MKPDIESRVVADYRSEERDQVRAILELVVDELGLQAMMEGSGRDRICRCLLFLSKGDMALLVHFADAALADPRDVMYWAEYNEVDDRLRDLNEPFADAGLGDIAP